MDETSKGGKILRTILLIAFKLILAGCVIYLSVVASFFILIFGTMLNLNIFLVYASMGLLPLLGLPLIFLKNRQRWLSIWGIGALVFAAVVIGNMFYTAYDNATIVDTSPNINIHEYLPFKEDSKIVKLDKEASLQLTGDLPIIDGAAAVFPVYSAFVHAVYPETTELYDGVFEYNNTGGGYQRLARKKTDIFFGAYPSQGQIDFAAENGTEFVFTPIGSEAFVFFVHKDNPVDSLTTEQIQKIYSGEITNWAQVGGSNEPIAAFQRNEGSGSQSMLIRFMNGKTIMDPPSELRTDLMSGIVELVSDYRSKSGSIGFSFRYYMEGIIQNPDIKLLAIDGVSPTIENIKNGTYPIVTPLYAVTWKDNPNKNVQKLLDWVLSEEGQYILETTGYVGIGK